MPQRTKRTTSGIPTPPEHHHSTGEPESTFRRGRRGGNGTGSWHQKKDEPTGDRIGFRGLTALPGISRHTDLAARAKRVTDEVAHRETEVPRRRTTRNQEWADASTTRTDIQAWGYVHGHEGCGMRIQEDQAGEGGTGKKESQRRGVAKEKPAKCPSSSTEYTDQEWNPGGQARGGGAVGKATGTMGTRRNAARTTTEATA